MIIPNIYGEFVEFSTNFKLCLKALQSSLSDFILEYSVHQLSLSYLVSLNGSPDMRSGAQRLHLNEKEHADA